MHNTLPPIFKVKITNFTQTEKRFNPHTENVCSLEKAFCFLRLLHIFKMHFTILFMMDAYTMNPGQTAGCDITSIRT